MTKRATDTDVTIGSGNVFADLKLPRPEETFAKAEIARHIGETIAEKRLTQSAASKILGIGQPKVSELLRGRLSGFSTERLFRFVIALGGDVEILLGPKKKNHAKGELRVLKKAATGVR